MYLLEGFIAARAQLVTFIIFVLELFFIEKFLENKKIGYAIGLIILPILIANLHCAVWPFYFVLFLPYVGEYVIAKLGDFIIYKKFKIKTLNLKIKKLSKKENSQEKVEKIKNELQELEKRVEKIKQKRENELKNPYKISINKNENVKYLIIIMIICAFTGLLTPLGDTPYTYLSKTMQGNTTQNINEHLPMILINQVPVVCTLIVFLSILTFTKTKIKLSDLFMLGGLCILMLSSRRQLSMFTIICSVVLSRLMVNLTAEYEYEKDTLKKIRDKIASSVIATIVLIAAVGGLSYYMGKDKIHQPIIDESSYPVQACDYIVNNIDLTKARFYNEYNYGSYMLFRGIPVFINIPVFIDSRADLYAPEFSGWKDDIFSDFINVSGLGEFYEDIFEKYGITHVICYRNSKINLVIIKSHDTNYNEIYVDNNFIIYERLNANKEKTEEINSEDELKDIVEGNIEENNN